MKQQAENSLTSGASQKESLIQYTKLNYARVKRLEKQVAKLDFTKIKHDYPSNIQLIALTETWCGDAAQSLSFINAFAKAQGWPALRILWRDENPELIDQYHTNGTRSIPKVLFVNEENEVLATWGPRPAELQEYVMEAKKKPDYNYPELSTYIQKWYNKDKAASVVSELEDIVSSLD